ncbi:hypothetical protein LTR10_010674 [Elasticomyces elasticus]|nr:hypothetical protein LTR10_010674 [Elasticomyces elasticus]KAK4968280.1 hypothetical protein LTR42_009563 [Elasticomyces elasticus]
MHLHKCSVGARHCSLPETQRFQANLCGAPVRSGQQEIITTAWALWALTVLATIGRFAARSPYFEGAGYGWDDWFILVVEAIVTAITVVGYLSLAKDMWMVAPHNITRILKYFWLEEMLYTWAVQFTKISILLFYLRIFPNTVSNHFRMGCYAMMGICLITAVGFTFSTMFQCSPMSYSWTLWDGQHEGHCDNTLAQIYAGSGINIVYDLIVFILPIPKLLKVQISNKKKAGIVMTFMVGLFVTACSVIRLAYVVRWRKTTNPTWSYAPIALWSIIEVDVGVVCACMPSLAGPIKRFWVMAVGQHLSSLYESRSKTNKSPMPSQGHTTSSNSKGWSNMSKSADHKPQSNSIMRNVDLNISDEMELVDKNAVQSESVELTPDAHNYRQKW